MMSEVSDIQSDVKKASIKLVSTISQLKAQIKSMPPGAEGDKLKEELKLAEARVKSLKVILPETRSLFSRLILGRVNLKQWTTTEKDRLRDEYNRFKSRTNFIFMGLPLIVLFSHYYLRKQWKDTHWLNIMYQIWMLYYYVSMALRENILLVNGSNIHPWWIIHHYIAAFGTIIVITWPPTEEYVNFVPFFTWFLVFQGFVQMLQLWYQTRRDYANRALGIVQRMDISYPETITEFPKELLVLVPFIFTSHIWQLFIGISLFGTLASVFDSNIYWTDYTQEVQILIIALVFTSLGIGNILATIKILWNKAKKERIMSKARKQKNGLTPSASPNASPKGSTNDLSSKGTLLDASLSPHLKLHQQNKKTD